MSFYDIINIVKQGRLFMKKIVIFGGGTGLSQILKGLRLFPLDITAVVSVSDSGRSTGALRKIYDIPAIGDLSKVLISTSNLDDDVIELLNYRVKGSNKENEYNHSIKNLILTALVDIHGSVDKALTVFCEIFNIENKVLPITEESVNLIAKTDDGEVIIGENEITEAKKNIKTIWYDKAFLVNPKVIKSIESADLIIFSPGSLYTSILPHIMIKDVAEAMNKSKAKKMYIANLVTQPGETNNLPLSSHVKILNKYLNFGIDVVVANKKISNALCEKYQTREQKVPVDFDEKELKKIVNDIIADKIYKVENGFIRHDSLKTAYLIFSYLMDGR